MSSTELECECECDTVCLPHSLTSSQLYACACLLLPLLLLSHAITAWPLRHIPGPPRIPILGHIPHLMSRPWARMLAYARTYGGVVKMCVCVRVLRCVLQVCLRC